MDLLFTTTTASTTTAAPILYGSLLDNGLTLPYDNKFGIASLVARDMSLALFFMMASYTGRPDNPNALFQCDFESGWCPGFETQRSSDIPWTLMRGPTPSNLTGPSHDHTRFNEYGTYIYMEASKRRIAETAVFSTPGVMMLEKPYYCLRFWYNMFGDGSGSLWVYWNAAGAEDIRTVVDKHAGEKSKSGNDWRESLTTLQASSTRKFYRPVIFEFRAIRGTNYKSDIAIDDILLVPGKCKDISFSKTATTMTFRGITTRPTPPTTPSWKVAHPDWSQCGADFSHVKKDLCCDGHARKIRGRNQQCCGTRTFNIIYNICCGGTALSVNSHGCCGGRYIYKKREKGCCSDKTTYLLLTHECRNGAVKKRRPVKSRGKRSVTSDWGFWQYLPWSM